MIDHSNCRDGERNPDCPTGLHTRVALLAMGAMLERKRRQLADQRVQSHVQTNPPV